MSCHATFDDNGFPIGFWPDATTIAPEDAIAITDDQHADLVLNAGLRRWDGTAVVAYALPVVVVPLASLQALLCSDVDREAEAQRLLYITPGEAQMATYLLKRGQALGALAAQTGNTAANMTADALAAAYPYLANEIGITPDPTTKAAATDVYGVARAVQAVAIVWQGLDLAIEKARLAGKAAINAATTVAAAQAVHDAVAWPTDP